MKKVLMMVGCIGQGAMISGARWVEVKNNVGRPYDQDTNTPIARRPTNSAEENQRLLEAIDGNNAYVEKLRVDSGTRTESSSSSGSGHSGLPGDGVMPTRVTGDGDGGLSAKQMAKLKAEKPRVSLADRLRSMFGRKPKTFQELKEGELKTLQKELKALIKKYKGLKKLEVKNSTLSPQNLAILDRLERRQGPLKREIENLQISILPRDTWLGE